MQGAMQGLRAISAIALTIVLGSSVLVAAEPRQATAKLDKQVRVALDYLVYLPPDFDKHPSWPLLLFLHGAGERGSDLQLVKKHGPPRLIDEGKDFPFVVVSPQCAKDRFWTTQMLELAALLDEIVARYKIDQDRVYVSGLSMGGFGTWSLAAYSPERFAAIMPICGGGEPIAARRLGKLPVWAFHGGKDLVVPLKRSEDMIAAIKNSNPEAKLTVYPEAGHDSWSETYANPEVYQWLLRHKRNGAPEDRR